MNKAIQKQRLDRCLNALREISLYETITSRAAHAIIKKHKAHSALLTFAKKQNYVKMIKMGQNRVLLKSPQTGHAQVLMKKIDEYWAGINKRRAEEDEMYYETKREFAKVREEITEIRNACLELFDRIRALEREQKNRKRKTRSRVAKGWNTFLLRLTVNERAT